MFFAHVSDKVSRCVILWFFLFGEPFQANAIGNSSKDTMQAQGFGVPEAASIIVAGGVQATVQAGFNAPVVDIFFEPLFS